MPKNPSVSKSKEISLIKELLESKLSNQHESILKIEASLNSIDQTLQVNTKELAIHIQGVVQLKETNALLREEINLFRQQVQAQVAEINSRITLVEQPFNWFKMTSNFAHKASEIIKFIVIVGALFGGYEAAKIAGLLGGH